MTGRPVRRSTRERGMGGGLDLLDEGAGVDLDRARGLAHGVTGTAGDSLVGEVGPKGGGELPCLPATLRVQPPELPRHPDALTGRQEKGPGRAAGLAKTALEAAIVQDRNARHTLRIRGGT